MSKSKAGVLVVATIGILGGGYVNAKEKSISEAEFKRLAQRVELLEQQLKESEARNLQAAQGKLEKTDAVEPKKVEQKVKEPERNLEVQKELADANKKQDKPFGTVQADAFGFRITSANGDYELRLKAVVQADQDIFFNTKGETINTGISSIAINDRNTVDRLWMRRVRPIMWGTIFKHTDIFVQPDFGQGQARLLDAVIDIHYLDWLSLAVGKQVSPLGGIENLKMSANLSSMELGYPSVLAPNRELGLMFHGRFNLGAAPKYGLPIWFADQFTYQIGLFSGTADNTNPGLNPVTTTNFSTETSTLGNKGVEARIFAHPFRTLGIEPLEGLGIGISGGYDNPNNQTTLPALVSVGQNPIFTYVQTIAANGTRLRIHPQAYWYWGPFGVLSDWTQTTQTLSSNIQPSGPAPVTQSVTMINQAAQVQVSYNLTGEKNSFGAIIPNNNFDPFGGGGWGAFQLAGRWTGLYIDNNVFNASSTAGGQTTYTFADPRTSVQSANTWSVGINWILNPNVKITTEYDQTSFVGGCSTGAMSAQYNPGCLTSGGNAATAANSVIINRPNEKVFMQRFQLSF